MSKRKSKSKVDTMKVIFRKDKNDGEVVAFFPETVFDGSVNYGMIMSYAHVGQSGEASIRYFQECKSCDKKEYGELLKELKWYLNQDPDEPKTVLKVMKRIYYGNKRPWPRTY